MFKLTTGQKIFISLACFAIAIVGFLLRLPSAFRGMDKELHAAFYFLSAAFLNVLFAKRNFFRHAIIFIFLYLFGVAIEYVQPLTNKFFGKRLHGRFDPEDVAWNLKGLLAFSILWMLITLASILFKKASPNKSDQ